MITSQTRLIILTGLSIMLAGCAMAPGSFVEFKALKDSKTNPALLNTQVSITPVDADVVRRLSESNVETNQELISLLEPKGTVTTTKLDRAIFCRLLFTTTPS